MYKVEYRSDDKSVKFTNRDLKAKLLVDHLNVSSKESKNPVDKCSHFLYCVRNDDTIERVAAKCKMTPNELMSLNKMTSRTLFVSQRLKVTSEADSSLDYDNGEKEGHSDSAQYSKKYENSTSDSVLFPLHGRENHMKVVAKYITDSEGIIKGKLLLTPAFFTFTPAFSDPVVIEYGDDKYTIHLPNNKISCVSMYNDSEMMAYKRSQRTDMISNIPSSSKEDNSATEDNSTPGDKLIQSVHLSLQRKAVIENSVPDYTSYNSMEHILGKSMCVNSFERSDSLKFMDHKYLCVVASPRYRKIQAVYQKEDEYWFIVPTESTQCLMDYLLLHARTKYDMGADIDWMSVVETIENDFGLLKKVGSFTKVEDIAAPTKKEKNKSERTLKNLRSKSIQWEVVNNDLDYRLNSYDESEEVYSKVLDQIKVKQLMKHLPSETVGATWELIYSTDRDGWSLSTLYRHVYNSTRGCCLFLIKDSNSTVFGAMCNSYIHMSNSFYGNGTTFIFRWYPNLEIFPYSHKNNYFLYGQPDFFAIGCSNFGNALRIGETLFSGVTHTCETFDSPALVTSEAFDVSHLEVWSFY